MIDESALKSGLNIYCHTPEDCDELLTGLHDLGYKWASGNSLLKKDAAFFNDVWVGDRTFVIYDKQRRRIKCGGGKATGAVCLSQILISSFTPAPEADFLSALGGFSESEVSHAHP